jgi:hypothetical protein
MSVAVTLRVIAAIIIVPGAMSFEYLALRQSAAQAADDPPPGIPDSGLGRTWRVEKDGMGFRLTGIRPDQIRAVYGARGFSEQAVQTLARACFFQTVIRNDTTDRTARVNLAEWRIENHAAGRPLTLERDWQWRLQDMKLTPALRQTLRYALFPTVQQFAPGDWIMGMTSISPPPAERFNVRVRWHMGDDAFEALIEGVECK